MVLSTLGWVFSQQLDFLFKIINPPQTRQQVKPMLTVLHWDHITILFYVTLSCQLKLTIIDGFLFMLQVD